MPGLHERGRPQAGTAVRRPACRARTWTRGGVILALALVSAWNGACQRSSAETSGATGPRSTPYTVVTTVAMITDIVSEVAGDRAQVRGLIGSGVDPHLYKPTRNDVALLQAADVIFYNGLMLEGKMTDVLLRMSRGGRSVYAVTELINEDTLLEPEALAGHTDPHVWMDVSAWQAAVRRVAAALAEFDPENRAHYEANASRLEAELAELHEYVRTVTATIPTEHRVLITAHDAFNYFGRAYGLRVLGIQGLSTESEAGLEDIRRLVDLIVTQRVPAVFVETSVDDKNVTALLEGARARGATVRLGGTLYSDAMGAPGTYEGTYVGMIDHNATTIARALGGDAPARGWRGRLATGE